MVVWEEPSAAWIGLLPGPDPGESTSLLSVFGSAMKKDNKNLVVRTEGKHSNVTQVNIFSQVSKQNGGILYAH